MIAGKKIAGLMAVANFPMATEMAVNLAKKCDYITLRYDQRNGDTALWRKLTEKVSKHVDDMRLIITNAQWNRWNWREDLIRSLDDVRPDYVFFLDSDERYGSGFGNDVYSFMDSGDDIMMFDYKMVSDDGRRLMKYPKARHCKAFRWVPGITYRPYKGYAKPCWPDGNGGICEPRVFLAKAKIEHYCFYTKDMEANKVLHK